MGAVLAKFRKEKSPGEVLEKLETEIRTIEKFSLNTQQKQKRLVGNFLVLSIGLYALGFIIFYFLFFPPTWPERITYLVPLLTCPLIIIFLKQLLAWYFQRKINKNSTKLVKLREEKKRILEEVMEKETYNVASKLLSKYGDKSYGIKSLGVTAPTPQPNKIESRIQNLNTSITAQPLRQSGTIQPFNQAPLNRSLLSVNNGQQSTSPGTPRSSITPVPGSALRYRGAPPQMGGALALPNPRPYPIINQKTQSVLEKMVDYLIGDGPQNRYALICKGCFAHNGMARQEEFEYATFRCAFCNELNPSRKSRPVGPKMPSLGMSPLNTRMIALPTKSSDSESSDSSGESDVPRQIENVSPKGVVEKEPEPTPVDDINHLNTNGNSVPSEKSESELPIKTEVKHDKEEPMDVENEEEKEEVAIKESETKQ